MNEPIPSNITKVNGSLKKIRFKTDVDEKISKVLSLIAQQYNEVSEKSTYLLKLWDSLEDVLYSHIDDIYADYKTREGKIIEGIYREYVIDLDYTATILDLFKTIVKLTAHGVKEKTRETDEHKIVTEINIRIEVEPSAHFFTTYVPRDVFEKIVSVLCAKEYDDIVIKFLSQYEPHFLRNIAIAVYNDKGDIVRLIYRRELVNGFIIVSPKRLEISEIAKIGKILEENNVSYSADRVIVITPCFERMELSIPHIDLSKWYPKSFVKELETLIIVPNRRELPYAPRNILLIGPPGCGKTFLSKAILYTLGYRNYLLIDPSMYRTKWYGESESKLKHLLQTAEKNKIPIIFDNAEALGSREISYDGVADYGLAGEVSILLNHLEQNKTPIFIILNYLIGTDDALIRHERIDLVILLLYPDKELREKAVMNIAKTYNTFIFPDTVWKIVENTELFTLSELKAVIRYYLITRDLEKALSLFKIDREKRRQEIREYIDMARNIKNIILVYPKYREESSTYQLSQ